MLHDENLKPFTRADLIDCLKLLGKEYRKRAGTKMPAEIILVGGAAVLARYGFRELTYDVDAIVEASSAMKDAISCVRDKLELQHGWLNADFTNTASYSQKLREVSVYYKTFSNVLQIRAVAAEYLLAMKLMSGRQYKNDLSDVIGILWEHQKAGESIRQSAIEKAIVSLYGQEAMLPKASKQLLLATLETDDYESLYQQVKKSEKESRELFLAYERKHSSALKNEDIDHIISDGRKRHATSDEKESLLAQLEEARELVHRSKNN